MQHSEPQIIKFNSNSRDFDLGWKHIQPDLIAKTDPPLSGVLSDRGNKFIQKTERDKAITFKVGSPEVKITTPLLSPRITRNVSIYSCRKGKDPHSTLERATKKHKAPSVLPREPKRNGTKYPKDMKRPKHREQTKRRKKCRSWKTKSGVD